MTDLATAYANAGKALLDLADAIQASPEPLSDPLPFEDTPQGRSAGGGCPVHDVPWVIRPAGISKATGAPYRSFWHCNEQDPDGTYCRQEPTAAWVKAHPIR